MKDITWHTGEIPFSKGLLLFTMDTGLDRWPYWYMVGRRLGDHVREFNTGDTHPMSSVVRWAVVE